MSKQINDQELEEMLVKCHLTEAVSVLRRAKVAYLDAMTIAACHFAQIHGIRITGPADHIEDERPLIGFAAQDKGQPMPVILKDYDHDGDWE